MDINFLVSAPHPGKRGSWLFEFDTPSKRFRQQFEGPFIEARNKALVRAEFVGATEVSFLGDQGLGIDSIPESEISGPAAMVALHIPKPLADKIVTELPEGSERIAPQDMHITLAYLGDLEDQAAKKEDLVLALKEFAEKARPLTGNLQGYGTFNQSDQVVFHVLFDCIDLPEFRQALVNHLLAAGASIARTHGFIPHITIGYIPKGAPIPSVELPEEPVTLDTLVLGWGKKDKTFVNLKFIEGEQFLIPEDEKTITYVTREDDKLIRHFLVSKQPSPVGSIMVDPEVIELPAEKGWTKVVNNLYTNEQGQYCWVQSEDQALLFEDSDHLSSYVYSEDVKMAQRDDFMVAWGGPIKALGDGKIGGQLILYGAPGMKDLTGDWFSKDTYYGPRDGDGSDVMIHHGIKIGKGLEEFADKLLEPMKTSRNKLGIWAETVLDMADEFEKKVYELAEKGVWKWSSGTADHMIRKQPDGKLLRWPIIEGSLTPTPAEPRMLNHAIRPLKSLADVELALENGKWVQMGGIVQPETIRKISRGRAVLAMSRRF